MPSTCRWRGNAPAVAQVDLVTIHHVEEGVVYTLTNGGKTVTYTATDEDTVTTVMVALAALWNAAIQPQFGEITALAESGTITLTADFEGVPFDLTVSQTGDGGNVEIKTVTINNSPTGGTWSWIDSTYGTASGLAYNISAASLETALKVIYGNGNVTVAGSNGGPFTVTFGGTLVHVNIPDTTFDNSTLTGGNATVLVEETRKGSAGVDEIQVITFYGSPSGGTFVASFNGFSTSPLAYNISAANFQTALRGLASIGSTGVSVTGSAGGPYTATFGGTLAGTAVPNIEIDPALLTGGTIFGTTSTTTPGVDGVNEVQYLTQDPSGALNDILSVEMTGTVTAGTFEITYSTYTSDPIPFDVTGDEFIELLEAFIEEMEGPSVYAGPYFAPQGGTTVTLQSGPGFWLIQGIGRYGATDDLTSYWYNLGIDSTGLTGGTYVFPGPNYSNHGTPNGRVGGTAGKFTLSLGGQTTPEFNLTATNFITAFTSPTAAQVQAALENLSTIGAGNVLVTKFSEPTTSQGGQNGFARGLFRVEFIGALSGTNVGPLNGTVTLQPTGPSPVTASVIKTYVVYNGVAGTDEVQSLSLSGTPSNGTFTLSFGAATTSALAYNASAADVQAALEALSNIGAGNVVCSGGALPGTPISIHFTGLLHYLNVAQIVIDDAGLKVLVTETTPGVTAYNEIQTVSLTGSPFGGTATLTYSGQTTSALQWNSTASDVQTALIALSNLASGDVVCTGGPWPSGILCTFGASLAATDVAAMTGTPTLDNGTVTSTSLDPMHRDAVTANSGPGDITVVANWSNETLPVAGDTVVVDQGTSPMLYHLDQLATGLAAFYHYSRFTGEIGLPEINQDFGTPYYEFRPQYLTVDAPIIRIGDGGGQGSGRIKIKGVIGTAPTVNVNGTATSLDDGIEACLLILPHASSVLDVNRGEVGVAIYPGETSTVATSRIGFQTNIAGDSTVRYGSGVTLTTIEMSGGKVTTNSGFTTLNMTAGELIHESGAVGTANIDSGAVRYRATETLTTVVVGEGGILDFSQDLRPRTVTNISLNAGSEYHDPHGTVTATNGFDFVRCQPSDVTFEVKPNQTLSFSVI